MSEDVVNIQLQESFSVTASVVRETSQSQPSSGATMEESVGGGLDRQLGVEVAGRQGAGGVKGGPVTHRHQLRQSGPTGGVVQCRAVL